MLAIVQRRHECAVNEEKAKEKKDEIQKQLDELQTQLKEFIGKYFFLFECKKLILELCILYTFRDFLQPGLNDIHCVLIRRGYQSINFIFNC